MTNSFKTILFVDDDPDDRIMLESAIHQIDMSINIVEAQNGKVAMEYLGTAKESGQLPCLIVLDLNMPILDGKQTFTLLKQDLDLKEVPVIIFTSTSNPNDKSYFQQQGIGLITKPSSISFLKGIAEQMVTFCD